MNQRAGRATRAAARTASSFLLVLWREDVLLAQLQRLYMAKSVIIAAKIIRTVEGMIPAREKAMGSDSTPPPQTVATRPTIATTGEDLRDLQSCAGYRNSSEWQFSSSSLSERQKVKNHLRSGGR